MKLLCALSGHKYGYSGKHRPVVQSPGFAVVEQAEIVCARCGSSRWIESVAKFFATESPLVKYVEGK